MLRNPFLFVVREPRNDAGENRLKVWKTPSMHEDTCTTRVCKSCGVEKPIFKFTLRARQYRKSGEVTLKTRGLSCANCDYEKGKDKSRASLKIWEEKNPDRVREYRLRRLFGIGFEDYQRMFAAQKGLCAICKKPGSSPFKKRTLGIDHDHKTKAVRGLLCDRCNQGIGQFQDNPDLLKSAMQYLSRGVVS